VHEAVVQRIARQHDVLEDVQHRIHRLIADRMHDRGHVVVGGQADVFIQVFRRVAFIAHRSLVVDIGHGQAGGMRAQGAVGHQLQGADAEEVIAGVLGVAVLQELAEIFQAGEFTLFVDADRQALLEGHLREDRQDRPVVLVQSDEVIAADAGDAVAIAFLHAGADVLLNGVRIRLRPGLVDQIHGRLLEHAAFKVDGAAVNIRLLRDAGQFQGLGVADHDMAVHAGQGDRHLDADGIEVRLQRTPLAVKVVFVVAAADDPRLLLLQPLLDQLLDVLDAAAAGQLQHAQIEAKAEQMQMGIHKAGIDIEAVQVHGLIRGRQFGLDLGVRSHFCEAAVLDQKRRGIAVPDAGVHKSSKHVLSPPARQPGTPRRPACGTASASPECPGSAGAEPALIPDGLPHGCAQNRAAGRRTDCRLRR